MSVNQSDLWGASGRMRRLLVLSGLAATLDAPALDRPPNTDASSRAQQGRPLVFPRDHGSHPEQRTEWWYITGHTSVGAGAQARDFGFQLTFFRTRVDATRQMASRFAARQLLFAHAALSDVQGNRFWHDQRIARQGFERAAASELDTALRLGDWSLVRQGDNYRARVPASEFALDLSFARTQDILLQGSNGVSLKGPEPGQFSHYYSVPQLAFEGEVRVPGERFSVSGDGAREGGASFSPSRGAAWLDHEWGDSLLPPDAVGWDWIGINLFDGSALTAFRIRDRSGNALWDGGSLRRPLAGERPSLDVFRRGDVSFQPVRRWSSALTRASYPVEWLLRTRGDNYLVKAVLDNQELDSRNSTGAVYWEGLSDLFDTRGQRVGRGYLEMTGYAKPLVL